MVHPGIPVSVKVGVGGTVPPVLCDDAGQSNGIAVMKKTTLSERGICTKYITPAILAAEWSQYQFREEVKLTTKQVVARDWIIQRKVAA